MLMYLFPQILVGPLKAFRLTMVSAIGKPEILIRCSLVQRLEGHDSSAQRDSSLGQFGFSFAIL